LNNLFIRLYLILILAFVGLGISIDTYVAQTENEQNLISDIALHKGTLFLLNKELQRLPAAEWPAYLNLISPSFGYPITLVAPNQRQLSQPQLAHLKQGGIVSNYHEQQGKAWFYQQLSNSQQLLELGPIAVEPSLNSNIITNLLFFSGLALVVFLWAWPISRGLHKLTQAAIAFGKGDFSVRASNSRSAPLMALVSRFNAMASRIQRLIKSHQELSHAVSHELRTPIARIRFAMEMVRELDDKNQQSKYLQTMDDNIEELDGLVDELLTYARFDREQPDLNIDTQNIVSTCHQVIEKFQLTHSQLKIQCTNPSEQILNCRYDQDAITRALDNLVRNACRYAKLQIQVSVQIVDRQVLVSVDDDGQGIPIESRDKLFQPFVRLDQSRDRSSGGIGLGLAMVKRLLELHQGSAKVIDTKLGGASFVMAWPTT
jgi:signal transduction histidine kinase